MSRANCWEGIFLKEWLNEWYSLYESVWALPLKQQSKQMDTLEDKVELLLTTWGSLDESMQELKRKVKEEAHLYQYQSKGTILFDQGQFQEACAQLKQEEHVEKDGIRCLYVGYASLYQSDLVESEAQFQYVLFLQTPALITHLAYKGLGLIAIVQHDMEKAIHYLEKAQPLAENHELMYNLGVCYFTLGNYEYATTCFRQYAYHVEDVDGLYALALALVQAGELEEARAAFLQVIENLHEQSALVAVAHFVEWIGEHELACYAYEHLMIQSGKEQRWLHGFAWNKALSGDKRAVHLLSELSHTDPEAKKSYEWIQATMK